MSSNGSQLQCGRFSIDLRSPKVMGILNVTPDSFSDGGRFVLRENALKQARSMLEEGAAIIDVGGESTRPGAEAVSAQQEMDRVIPVVEALAADLDIPVSIDSKKSEVIDAALQAGATMVNDVLALQDPGSLDVVASHGVPVCLMHMQGRPETMQDAPSYGDIVDEVISFLGDRVDACVSAGISRENIIIDPGFGFGKSLEHNLCLMKSLDRFYALGCHLLVGVSRKSMIGNVLDVDVDGRLSGSLALASLAVWQGARIIRAHDVKQTVDAISMCAAVMNLNSRDVA